MKSESRSDTLSLKNSFRETGFSGKTALILASWFGTGLLPRAPGTFGSLAALPLVIAVKYLGTLSVGIALILCIPLAIWSAGYSGKLMKQDDPPEVVIDEVAGLLVTLSFLPLSWLGVSLGFVLFRVFDIWKPFPIGWVDQKIKGGIGIVLDDILAGIYAIICARLFLLVF